MHMYAQMSYKNRLFYVIKKAKVGGFENVQFQARLEGKIWAADNPLEKTNYSTYR